uniref:Neprosin PEP catalytic domain-containing protein n=1 Tax=Brassica oleracea var. oleracea TaxID=109376 RepID=A0A0D3EG50_BRAOL
MNIFVKLVLVVFIVSLAQSREIVRYVKSSKLNEKILYDCVDIYKQPSLSHPLLKNHKIQMEPSFLSLKPKKQVKNEIENRIRVECPNGTVPILKNTKQYVGNAQYWAERHFNPLTDESHGKHMAGVREQGQGPYHGVAAWMTVHDLNVSRDQASYANIYAGSVLNNKTNFIQTGWMVNPSLFGDGQTWRYGFWKGADGAGCYNTICPGFIQVSKTDLLSGPIPHPRKGDRAVFPSIVQVLQVTLSLEYCKSFTMFYYLIKDEVSGHWWTAHVRNFKKDIAIGYWPKELFDIIGHSVNMVGVTGAVQASPSGISPPMGNGHLPTKNEDESARVRHLVIVNSKFKGKELDISNLDKLLDSNKCYGLRDGKKRFFLVESNLFTYGGPGGKSC